MMTSIALSISAFLFGAASVVIAFAAGMECQKGEPTAIYRWMSLGAMALSLLMAFQLGASA